MGKPMVEGPDVWMTLTEIGWVYPAKATTLEEAARLYSEMSWMADVNNDTGGAGLCADVSAHFFDYLKLCGLADNGTAGLRWMNLMDPQQRYGEIMPDKRYPDYSLADMGWPLEDAHHCVLLVGDTVYDFTARQFDDELPYPFIWKIGGAHAEAEDQAVPRRAQERQDHGDL